jgi:hypothetical protein
MKESIPEVKPMKGTEIPEASCGLPHKLTREEQDKVQRALDNIVFNYYAVWFGYPVRSVEAIKKDLHEAKQLLAQVKCPEVI